MTPNWVVTLLTLFCFILTSLVGKLFRLEGQYILKTGRFRKASLPFWFRLSPYYKLMMDEEPVPKIEGYMLRAAGVLGQIMGICILILTPFVYLQ